MYSRIRRRGGGAALTLLLPASLLVACGDDDAPELAACETTDEVTVRLSYLAYAAHIPVIVAKERGLFEDACMVVKVNKGRGSSFAATAVGSGKETFGYADDPAVVTAASQGVPVVAVADLYSDSGQALIATEESGIEEPGDFAGKTMVVFTGSATEVVLRAWLEKEGLTGDVKLVSAQAGGDLPILLEGKADGEIANALNDVVAWRFSNPELEVKVWKMTELGLDLPGAGLIASRDTVENDPDLVERFVQATVEAAEWSRENPEEAVQLEVEAFPELKEDIELAKWAEYSAVLTEPIGSYDTARWESMQALLLEHEAIEKEVNIGELVTEDFLPGGQ
jgi:NitT/TauT family transport system substrate-binding protein